jgi:hypothetical protein
MVGLGTHIPWESQGVEGIKFVSTFSSKSLVVSLLSLLDCVVPSIERKS